MFYRYEHYVYILQIAVFGYSTLVSDLSADKRTTLPREL